MNHTRCVLSTIMLELRHYSWSGGNKLASSTYAPQSADNAGVPQEGT